MLSNHKICNPATKQSRRYREAQKTTNILNHKNNQPKNQNKNPATNKQKIPLKPTEIFMPNKTGIELSWRTFQRMPFYF